MDAVHHKPSKGHRDRFATEVPTFIAHKNHEEFISRVQNPTSFDLAHDGTPIGGKLNRKNKPVKSRVTVQKSTTSLWHTHSAEAVSGQMSPKCCGFTDVQSATKKLPHTIQRWIWHFLCRIERKVRKIQPIIHMVGTLTNVPTHIQYRQILNSKVASLDFLFIPLSNRRGAHTFSLESVWCLLRPIRIQGYWYPTNTNYSIGD